MQPKILYIDDEHDLVELASSFFEEENLPIDTSTNFNDAVQLIKQTKYDLIISDVNMPTGSGHDLFSLITKEGLFNGKFILVSGNVEKMRDSEINNYERVIIKPIRFEELIKEVKEILLK